MAKAAALLRVTQPSVSRAISDLEAALGVRLFDRSPRGVEPTRYGDALIKCGSVVFDELRQGIRNIEYLADPTVGELRIGCFRSVLSTALAPVIEKFNQQYPHVRLYVDDELVSVRSLHLAGLRDRTYDLTVVPLERALTDDESDLDVETLFHDRLVVAVGSKSRWVRRRKIDLAELVGEPWVLTPPGTPNYVGLAEALAARGLKMPTANIITTSARFRAHLVANAQFVTVLTGSALRANADRYELEVLPVDLLDRSYPIVILRLRNRTLSPVAERFIECAREVAKSFAKSKSRNDERG
jgi:DNA-binding transcriptional LysR family regulator